MQIYPPISHPLAVGQKVSVNKPSCMCRGATMEIVEGIVGKVITNNSGHWYYLIDKGITVKADWIISIQ